MKELDYGTPAQVTSAILSSTAPDGSVNTQDAKHLFDACNTVLAIARISTDFLCRSYDTQLCEGLTCWEWLHKPIYLNAEDELRRPWFKRGRSVVDDTKLSIYYTMRVELTIELIPDKS